MAAVTINYQFGGHMPGVRNYIVTVTTDADTLTVPFGVVEAVQVTDMNATQAACGATWTMGSNVIALQCTGGHQLCVTVWGR